MDFQLFIDYCKKHIKGDEKGEAQIFLDHLFIALGYADGLKGAGASCEYRVRDAKKKSTRGLSGSKGKKLRATGSKQEKIDEPGNDLTG